jgi:hypothetical protein
MESAEIYADGSDTTWKFVPRGLTHRRTTIRGHETHRNLFRGV